MCCVPLCTCAQCKKYRSQFTEEKKAVYEEKLEASELFKDKKALYPSRSVHSCKSPHSPTPPLSAPPDKRPYFDGLPA